VENWIPSYNLLLVELYIIYRLLSLDSLSIRTFDLWLKYEYLREVYLVHTILYRSPFAQVVSHSKCDTDEKNLVTDDELVKKRREKLFRRPSYRKILNDIERVELGCEYTPKLLLIYKGRTDAIQPQIWGIKLFWRREEAGRTTYSSKSFVCFSSRGKFEGLLWIRVWLSYLRKCLSFVTLN
jgi:hypothetical protein